ncbi:carbamoyltransferase N-terminal domain-containing protein [Nocardia sp. GTS18]|uniref:carbamoyltransferase N-terminal domain-containing protein n=1 Tax=Nocardia sp. GTS18 TaxID=1778064 RepID=UPI0015EF0EEF|nr:carbamoyltransferase N-terminal domain-containing protein [Nocardia sp. GTS18]
MLICGIKATHDGGIALIDNGRLVTSIEMEKIDNLDRYTPLGDASRVPELLRTAGIDHRDVDAYVVDGWWAQPGQDPFEPAVPLRRDDMTVHLPVAAYSDSPGRSEPMQRYHFDAHDFGSGKGYTSYFHNANHLLGSYCSSPFAQRNEDSLVLVWDGGTTPRLYDVRPADRSVRAVSSLLRVPGNFFSDFNAHFGPFRLDGRGLDMNALIRHHLSVAGKAMAYAALGTPSEAAFPVFDDLLGSFPSVVPQNAAAMAQAILAKRDAYLPGLSDADIIATFQEYLGQRLLAALARVVAEHFPGAPRNLCLGGGCALNIKWNSRIRASGLFTDVWVPPFPNDAGAAIGTACCEMWGTGLTALDWSVFSGPPIRTGTVPESWTVTPCDEAGVARILHEYDEPVVVLSGRAELGPRALGNRSILAPARDTAMKQRLNLIKDRADYRPVAPICLADRATEIFTPGGSDPYMLFEHEIRPDWVDRIPAVIHLDGTARLQTVQRTDDIAAARILIAYEALTGVPVLCNTSANLNGSGFFPDVASALRWGGTRYVWSDGLLYTNPDPTRSIA